MNHIITAVFTDGQTQTVAAEPLYQWAYGQTLQFEGLDLPQAYQVDFSNFEFCGESIPRIGGPDGVTIPVEVLSTGSPVYAFLWVQNETAGKTWLRVEIRVIPRPVPDLDTPNPEEESAIAEAIAALNDGVDAAEAQAVLAQSWAVGGTGTREGEDTNNAKYWAEQAAGGGGGTSDYNALSNKPAINGNALEGNKTPAQLGLVAAQQGAGLITDEERQQIQTNADDIAEAQGEIRQQGSDLQQLQTDVDAIEAKIPNQASAQNQLADKDFVNSSINSSTAFFRGAFATRAALFAVAWQTSDPSAANYVSNNDYAYVADDESQNDEAWRYIYVLEPGGQNNGWQPQFRVNESPLTAAQLAALNSGATAELILKITANETAIGKKYTKPSGGIPKSDLAAGVIPTVPTKTSELQNDSGFVDASGAASAAPVQSVNGQTGAVTVNVPSAASSGTPAMDGTASRGSSTQYARADHRHPSDTTKYTKPSTGIPKSDLAAAVQTSLDNADTALQAVPSTYRTAAAQDTIDAGKIDKPSNPATGAFLVWNGSTWSAQTLATWQGGNY